MMLMRYHYGKNVEAQIMESGNAMGVAPDDPIADSERGNSEDHAPFLSPDSLFANIAIGAMEGRVNIIGEDGQAKPTVLLHYWAWCSLVREILTEGLEKSVLSSSPHHFENINITLGTTIASIVM